MKEPVASGTTIAVQFETFLYHGPYPSPLKLKLMEYAVAVCRVKWLFDGRKEPTALRGVLGYCGVEGTTYLSLNDENPGLYYKGFGCCQTIVKVAEQLLERLEIAKHQSFAVRKSCPISFFRSNSTQSISELGGKRLDAGKNRSSRYNAKGACGLDIISRSLHDCGESLKIVVNSQRAGKTASGETIDVVVELRNVRVDFLSYIVLNCSGITTKDRCGGSSQCQKEKFSDKYHPACFG